MADNQSRPLYYSAWYIFNFGQIFPFSETHPNVTRGSEEYSAKVSVKDFPLYWVASGFYYSLKINYDPCTIVHGIYIILVRFFLHLKLMHPNVTTGSE